MHKIIIHSPNQAYGQYLRSLIEQLPLEPNLEILNRLWPQKRWDFEDQAGLMVFYVESEQQPLEGLLKVLPDRQKIVISNNASLNKPLPGTYFFSRPLDVEGFVRRVHEWSRAWRTGCETMPQAPTEPYLIGNSQCIRELRNNVLRVSKTDLTVLISGATGTGKGVLARILHNSSRRGQNQFLEINCGNLPTSLLEGELFGHKKGAFTEAWRDNPERPELVLEGSIFLDEISETSLDMQAKLLQVLEEKEIYPVGGAQKVKVRSRIVAATNADLKKRISQGSFREDVYYRLAVVKMKLPRLNERKEDIPILVEYFLDKFCREYNKKQMILPSREFWDLLLEYDWPGNVQELKNSIRAFVALESEEMVREKLRSKMAEAPKQDGSLCF